MLTLIPTSDSFFVQVSVFAFAYCMYVAKKTLISVNLTKNLTTLHLPLPAKRTLGW
jgi:hypothetical protein